MERTMRDETFTLPQFVFHYDLRGIFLSVAFCLLLIYGFSAVLFFGLEQLTNQSMRPVYTGIVLGYALNAVFIVILVNVFTRVVNDKLVKPAGQYALIIGASIVFSIFAQIIMGILYWQFIDLPPSSPDSMENRQPTWTYLLVPPFVAVLYYYFWQRSKQITRKISDQEYRLINMEKMKTKAELDALQARINPHFLYNALNSIAGLVHEDADKAEKMTLLLSKLFRSTIGSQDQHFNTIQHEVEIASTYLEVEQVRFGDRLQYSFDVEESLLQAEIPRFLLQPLVENAIKHGISKMAAPGSVQVSIRKVGDMIECAVADNGAPFPENFFAGYGLQSIQDKLHLLYAYKARLEIQNQSPKQVIIYIPC
jgi:two-component system, LytTR family, sensor kinase